ncbi:MAG: GDP-L-fucose synthase [Mariniphaga sp.]|nr:GDP-L-fucose synthase [Mariniphaga sp.]
MNKDSKIYVAGHNGLVGSAITKILKGKGYTIVIGQSSTELNLMDTNAVNAFFETEQPEYVILAAAKVGGIMANSTFRGQFIYENLMIQNNVIHASYLNNVKKLLFLGSTCIYPRDAPQPMTEDCLLTAPLEYTNEPYAIAKIAGIKMCESYNMQYGTNYISVMPTNLYGPNDNFDLEKSHVLPAMLRKMYLGKCLEDNNWDAIREDLKKRPIEGVNGEGETKGRRDGEKVRRGENENAILTVLNKYGIRITPSLPHPLNQSQSMKSHLESVQSVNVEIWGSGAPMREFLWSEEMADACVYLMERIDFKDVNPCNPSNSAQSASCEIRNTHINIGTGKEISIRDLAYLIRDKVGFKGELVFNDSKPDGTMRKLTDPSKLHKLGWKHQIEIGEGVEMLYKWYLGRE